MPAILVNDVSPVISYVATAAQTLFAIPFEFFDVGDIVVERAGVELVYSPTPANNNQYSVVGANLEGGGSITLGSPGATLGETIVIYRDVPIERLANYPETGPMAVRSLNAEQAKHIAMMQQLERDVNRSVTVPIGESSIDLPSAAERAEKILTFDAAGVPVTEFDIGLLTGAVISSGAAPAQNIEFTATASQTVFNFVYDAIPTYVSVFLNGVKLPSTDFTHSGTTVTLLTPATVGDRVALEGFTQSAILEALATLGLSSGSSLVGHIATGTGAVARTAQAKMRERLSVADFGATGDGTTNDATAIQATITAAVAAKKDVYFPYGIYKVNSTILKAQDFYCPNLYAEAGTVLDGTAISNAPTLKIKGGSGQLASAVIDGFRFRAGSGVNSTGLEIADQCGVEYQHCVFETGTWGVTYHNEAVSGFSEYCVGRNCTFLSALTSGALRYRVSSGNDSFNGSGLDNHCQIQFNGATNAIKIESGALVYNAPLSFQVWVTGSSKVIVNNASSLRQSTYGPITVEVFGSEPYATAPELFGGAGASVNHSGDVVSLGTSWLGPKVRLMGSRTVLIGSEGGAANGSVAFKQSPYSLLKTLSNAAGGTTILSLSEINSADMFVHIEGPNYDYRYRITAGVGLFGAGLVTNLSNPVAFNASGAGAPTFTVDSSGNFIITNTNYTTSYSAFVTIVPFGPARGAVLSSGADYKPS